MLNSFVCGTSNLPQEEDDIEELLAPCSKKNKKTKYSNNPYANRGLDKFSALLDELEIKKQKIYTQKGSNDISFVRFVYSNSNHWKPIVVKAKERIHQEQNQVINKKTIISRPNTEQISVQEIKNNIGRSRLNFKMIVLIILLFLVVFGKTFAILCSSFVWYFFEMIKDSRQGSSSTLFSSTIGVNRPQSKKSLQSVTQVLSLGLEKPKSKKSLQNSNSTIVLSSGLEKLQSKKSLQSSSSSSSSNSGSGSDKQKIKKKSTSPRSVLGELEEDLSGRHAHRKSW